MKKYIFIAIILFPLAAFSQEYEYIHFPDSGAIWSEVYQPSINHDLTWPDPIYERFALNGEDTIINDTTYKKLYIFYGTSFNKSTATYVGGIREDSSKRVYYRGDTIHFLKPSIYYSWDIVDPKTTELLLYDFTLTVGDTLKTGNLSTPDDFLIVSSIDTILIDNVLRKQYNFDPIQWVKWIEGIGNIRGLLFTSGDLPFNGIFNDLICFKQNSIILYFNNDYNDCIPLTEGIKTYQYNNSEIVVYPNPTVKDCITFRFGNCSVSNLKIFDCNGNHLGMYEVGGQSEYMIKTEKYQPGVYYYVATNKKGIGHTGKFVVL